MASRRKRWVISKIANSAKGNIESLDMGLQEKILIRLEYLQLNPFSGNVAKVHGKKNIFREKIGDYRFYFRIFPKTRKIEILLFDYRGKIKKKTIQRLK